MTEFTPTHRSKVKRLHERGRYDEESVFAILDAGMIAHIGYVIDGQPYVTPTAYWRRGRTLYWHGSSASRMLRTQTQGIPVCVTVTLLDGLVVARSGFHHSINYRSVVIFGRATLVEGAEKGAALLALSEHMIPHRWPDVREPNEVELQQTTVLSLPIDEASAKIRTGPPLDDEEDYALNVWAGVVPLRIVADEPIADPRLPSEIKAPEYLRHYRRMKPPSGA